MNEGKNNEDFATYKVNDYHFMLLERVMDYKIDRYKAFARYHFTLGSIAEDGHVFRKIKNRRDDAIAPAVHLIMIPIEKKYIRSKLPLLRVKSL